METNETKEYNPVFFLTAWIEKDMDFEGKHLEKGCYRFLYHIYDDKIENPCEFSNDEYHYEWKPCPLFASYDEFYNFFSKIDPKPMMFDKMDYCLTIVYRGYYVPIFYDDPGQAFYSIIDNKIYSFGSFQSDYESEVKDIIDYEIDRKLNSEKIK